MDPDAVVCDHLGDDLPRPVAVAGVRAIELDDDLPEAGVGEGLSLPGVHDLDGSGYSVELECRRILEVGQCYCFGHVIR